MKGGGDKRLLLQTKKEKDLFSFLPLRTRPTKDGFQRSWKEEDDGGGKRKEITKRRVG